jgi:baseplate J-like protein
MGELKGKRKKGAGAARGPGGMDPQGPPERLADKSPEGADLARPQPPLSPPFDGSPARVPGRDPPGEAVDPPPPDDASPTPRKDLPAGGAPAPGPSAREALAALRSRLAELVPGWVSRPEDPVNVLLEVVAEYAGQLREEISAAGSRAAESILLRLGITPRPAAPARGVVVFEPAAAGGSAGVAAVVPAGTRVVARRESGSRPRVTFETTAAVRIAAARLARALAVDGNEVDELPVDVAPGGGRAPAALFAGRLRAGRELYLGDMDLLELRAGRKSIRIEWPGAPPVVAASPWEYRAADGWRRLPALFEHAGMPTVLRMLLRGPLPDLARELRERADLPWIRCVLGAEALDLDAPVIASFEEGAAEASKGRAIARIFLTGPDESLDLSFDPRIAGPLASPDHEPALYLGWDAPSSSTTYMALEPPAEGALAPRRPVISWEYSSGDGWKAVPPAGLEDGTRGFTRSGLFTVAPAADWESRKLFGDGLFWVRARWESGERAEAVRVAALISRAAEVVQGRLVDELRIGQVSQIESGQLTVSALGEGEVEGFDRLEIRAGGSAEAWRRAASLAEAGPDDRWFVLQHLPGGGLAVHFGDGVQGRLPPSGAPGGAGGAGDPAIFARAVRVGIGAAGNIPPRTALVLEQDVPGIASAWNPLPAAGGEDREGTEALRRRASAEWGTGGRAVSAEDYDRWVQALLPGSRGALAGPDPLRPGGVLVVPIPARPRETGRFPPALLLALEKELGDRAPLGTPVRVAEPAVCAVIAEVRASPPAGEREAVRAQIHEELSQRLHRGGLHPGAAGRESPGRRGRGLNEELLRDIMAGDSPAAVRLLDRDGQPFSPGGGAPLDRLIEVVEVRFSGEAGTSLPVQGT